MKKRFEVSDDEKNRILGLHESFKNNNNIISEQDNTVTFDEETFKKESEELTNLGFKQGETPEPADKYEVKTLKGKDGDVTFYREKTKTADWDKKGEDKKGKEKKGEEKSEVINKTRDDAKIAGAKRDFENYFRNKIAGQQVNIYSDKKSRDKQKKKGGMFTKGLIDTVIFAGASQDNPKPLKNKKGQIVGVKLSLTDNKGYIQYKCSSDLDKLEKGVQYVNPGTKMGMGKEFIGPKDFVAVAMKTLCEKLGIYNSEMSKVPATSKF